jgi:hypothetical protein
MSRFKSEDEEHHYYHVIRPQRKMVESFLRMCFKSKPLTKKELAGRTLKEELKLGVDYIMANPVDLRAISIIMNEEDTSELPGKVLAWRKVLRGDC